MTLPIKGDPETIMTELVKMGIGFEFVPKRQERDNPGRDPYWAIYLDRHQDIPSSSLEKLAKLGIQHANGSFYIERRWPK